MKRSLGRAVWLLVLGSLGAWGATYQWRVLEAPQSLFVHQSGVVRYECAFSDSAAEYVIDFKPHGDERFDAAILTQQDRITDGRRVQTFDILVTPREAGEVPVVLNALVRHTTFASIENATIGRDNVKKYDFSDENVVLPKTIIRVKPNTAALSGEISMEVRVDKRNVIANEPVHVSLFIRGKGNLDRFVPYELNISGVEVFAEPPLKKISPSRAGFEGEIRQEFALVSDRSYTIPPIAVEVFDTAGGSRKILKSQSVAIEVAQGFERSNLLDPPEPADWNDTKRYILYGALVALGMAAGEAFRWLWRRRPRRRARYFWSEAKTPKELVLLLALSGEKKYEALIARLEEGKIGLGEAKAKLSTLTSDNEVKK